MNVTLHFILRAASERDGANKAGGENRAGGAYWKARDAGVTA